VSNVVGQLELQMVADLARIKQDMEAVKGIVGGGMDAVRRAAGSAQAALGAIGLGLSAAAFSGWIKGAVDAADEAGKLAQRMGTTVDQVAGLQLAFELGGSSSEGMGKAMGQLAKRMAEGDDALAGLGISATDANGKMRSTRDVLAEVSDRFKGADDGARKTALAMQLFGKSGAEMIPVLNAGSEGLREMDEMAKKLGLTIDGETAKQAEQFNDTMELVGKSGQGVARMVAAELLPMLTNLAGGLLESASGGNRLAGVAQFLANSLKVLFTGGVIGVEVFNSLGKAIGMAAGALVAVAQGEFRQGLAILKEGSVDIKAGWTSSLAMIEKAWSGTADAAVVGMAKMTKDLPDLSTKTRAAADSYAKLLESYQKLAAAGATRAAEQAAEAESGRKLTDAEKDYIRVMSDVAAGKVRMIDLQRLGIQAKLQENMATARAAESAKLEAEWLRDSAKANEETAAARRKATDDLQAQVAQDREAIATTGMSARQLAAHQAALLRDAAAAKDRAAVEADLVDWTGKASEEIRRQADLLRERAALADQGVAVKEAQAAAAEWQKTTDSIASGLTDAIMRGFEAGKGGAQVFLDAVKALFRTTILKIAVSPVQSGLNSFVGGIFGQPQAQGGGGGMFGGMQGLSSLYGYGSQAGAYLNAGALASNAAVYSGSAYGTGFASQQSAMLAAQEAGMTSSAGAASSMSAAGWAAAIAAGVYKANSDYNEGFNARGAAAVGREFGNVGGLWAAPGFSSPGVFESQFAGVLSKLGFSDKMASLLSGSTAVAKLIGRADPQVTEQGLTGSLGGAAGASLQQFAIWVAKGGLFRSDKTGTNYAAPDSETAKTLADQARAIAGAAAAYGKALGLPTDTLANVTTSFRVALSGNAEADQKAVEAEFRKYSDALFSTYSAALAPLKKAGETIEQTLTRLVVLQDFSASLNELGGVFSRIAGLGVDAREGLIAMAGGMDALAAKSQSFVQNYYNRDEIAGVKAREVQQLLAGAGITQDISTREQFRALVESSGTSNEQVIALLNVSDAFASLTDYLAETGTTLAGAASQAPEMAKLGGLFVDGSTAQVAATNAVQVAVEQVRDAIVQLQEQRNPGSGIDLYQGGQTEVTPPWSPGNSDGP
jgi:hypothetical protein